MNRRGQGFIVGAALFALAVLHNGLGQYAEALAVCETSLEYDDLVASSCVLVEAVEAATRCADSAAAGTALTRRPCRGQRNQYCPGPGGALTGAGQRRSGGRRAVSRSHLEAIAHLQHSPAVVYLARTHLVYGEWLRRQSRRVDARAQLRAALDMFTAMGADGFTERTRRELEATGETVRKRTGAAAVELTNQESHITQLARQGHTNSEIAARLFISPRTVEWHMGKIFVKLGVTSRK
jgi:DNA-binding CsgD family transcriptional regulator